ncbi:hypothetical protein B0H16DRAFT_1879673 [Mycena metata]|uniref:Polyketide synthase n=1 Tax=Mycena metata TaxID=1033252 RepID=A0AAD7K3D9_9AGAR|nr:hypothetical protein B0H16DRAFT_1879673 [Mycena metata]
MMNLEDKVAIVGIAAQLPSGEHSPDDFDYTSFWDFLLAGSTAHEPLKKVMPDFPRILPDVQIPTHGAFLKNVSEFDNLAFGLSTRDARITPYSARRVLKLAFQALEDSGIDYRGRKIGCFVSGNRPMAMGEIFDGDGSFSFAPSSAANRISYALDLTGPSVYLDTACSSSLTALHLAIGAIEKGDCSAALVGAAQVNRDTYEWESYSQAGVLAADGMSRPLDAAAAGFGRGEGGVAIVLKSLKDAVKDNDRIYGVVLGSAINATGGEMPLNVPHGLRQQECIQEACRRAGISPDDVDYVELHGTGTPIGDPIEANAAAQVFATERTIVFGTLKGNIGHLECAAFLASLVKACAILEHRIIPPTVNFTNPSPAIRWDNFHIKVPVEPIPLGCRSASGRPIISVSAYAIGGAAGHLVLQAPPSSNKARSVATNSTLFIIGGLSSSVVDQIFDYVSHLDAADLGTLRDCAVVLSRRARQLPWRKYFTIPSGGVIVPTTLIPRATPRLAFVFSGQGPQHLEMGRQLFNEYPVFRETIMLLDDVYRRVQGVSLIESTGLFAGASPFPDAQEQTWSATATVCAITMLQCALFDLLQSVGIVPDIILGHSAGETAAIYASGAGPKEMAMEIAIQRGEALSHVEGTGVGMATLACNAERASELMAQITARSAGVLELACFNAPSSVAVSGSASLLDELVTIAKHAGIFTKIVPMRIPAHSSLVDCIKEDFLSRMNLIFDRYTGSHSPRIPVYSTCHENQLVDFFDAHYFWDNCRNTVLFDKAISHSLSASPVFLEISCHPVLSPYIFAHGVDENRVFCPMQKIAGKRAPATIATTTESQLFLATLGRLSLLGINSLDLSGLYGGSASKSKFMDHPLAVRSIPEAKSLPNPKAQSVSQGIQPGGLRINLPTLAEHVINGEPILPATGFIELVLNSGARTLWDVEFLSMLSLSGDTPEVALQRLDAIWSITTGVNDKVHARGLMDKLPPTPVPSAVNCEDIFDRLPFLNFEDFYSSLEPLAAFGPRFRRVLRCHGTPLEIVAEILGPTDIELSSGSLLHPEIIDASLHFMLHPDLSKNPPGVIDLPSKIGHFVFYNQIRGTGSLFSHMILRHWKPNTRHYDVFVRDSFGLPICEFRDLVVAKFRSTGPHTVNRRFDYVFQPVAIDGRIASLVASSRVRPGTDGIGPLFEALDSCAIDMLSKSLRNHVSIGDEESRRRYFAFAQGAVARTRSPQPPETSVALQNKWPHHFEVTKRVAAVHESVFENSQSAVAALYSDDLMTKYYSTNSDCSPVAHDATQAISVILQTLRASGKKVVKILEVGAGTGLLTAMVIKELQRHADLTFEYTVTDISYALVANVVRSVASEGITLIPKSYDLSRDPHPQGIQPECYDLALAHHVLHATRSVNPCLVSLRSTLVPGGYLLAVELNGTAWDERPGSLWLDCIFGSFSEWFGYTDGRKHCALSPSQWEDHLQTANFDHIQTCVESGGIGHEFFLVAQRSITSSTSELHTVDPRRIYPYQFGKEIELQTRLRNLNAATSNTIYVVAKRGQDGDAALGLCAALRQERPLWTVRLAIFESLVDYSNPVPHLAGQINLFNSGESVISFDHRGAVHVPRVALLPPPPSPSQDSGQDQIHVRLIRWAGVVGLYDGFLAQVAESEHSQLPVGKYVAGIAPPSSAECIAVSANRLIPASIDSDGDFVAQLVGTLLISLISLPSSGHLLRMAVAIENCVLSRMLTQHALDVPGIRIIQTESTDCALFERFDILVTDSVTYAQNPHLRRWIPRSGRMFQWDVLLADTIRADPGYIQRTLSLAEPVSAAIPSPPTAPAGLPTFGAAPPFRGDRIYVLLGGIGGLGIDLAVWMYQRGARNLVLTSRRGLESLDPYRDALTTAKVAYLKSLDDLHIQFEKCDATDFDQMKSLVGDFALPIAGCIHMTLVLSDALFFNQTRDTFRRVHDSKIKVFEVFAAHIAIESLDFFVALSSFCGLLGIPGQTNYASACTALDGILARYPNAFSLITPGILDAGYLDRASDVPHKDTIASLSAEALWACLEDGLRKLDEGPFNQYIPDFDWTPVRRRFQIPPICGLLAGTSAAESFTVAEVDAGRDGLRARVLELLEVSAEDFDATQPLTTYGLDSISAARLAAILRPHVSVSQMQLLGGVTWSGIERQLGTVA